MPTMNALLVPPTSSEAEIPIIKLKCVVYVSYSTQLESNYFMFIVIVSLVMGFIKFAM